MTSEYRYINLLLLNDFYTYIFLFYLFLLHSSIYFPLVDFFKKFLINYYFSYMWQNLRLLEVDWLKNMWRPDSFFKNAKSVTFQTMTVPNHYLWLYKDKTILYMVKWVYDKLYLVYFLNIKFKIYWRFQADSKTLLCYEFFDLSSRYARM